MQSEETTEKEKRKYKDTNTSICKSERQTSKRTVNKQRITPCRKIDGGRIQRLQLKN
jgi:anti-sigma28 factor (negative regulator of flagellin synthesis)